MAKTLEFTINSPRQIKQGDTETTFTFICKNAGSVVDLTQATNITAKIGNASGYLRSQPITITSLAGLNPGWLNLQPMPDLISGLPAGNYQLEIWVTDQAGTSIYPSDAPLGFTITNNIENSSGASITTIAFDDFVEAMNKAASTIAKGDKGDTGTVDNAGLTTAPAFVALQTQVDNSAIGTNLLIGTSGTLNASTNASGWNSNFRRFTPAVTTVDSNTTYTVRAWIAPASYDTRIQLAWADSSGAWNYETGNIISAGTSGYSTWTGTLPSGSSIQYVTIVFAAKQSTGSTVSYKEFKLEKGSVATDWSLNPSEILTQSDYAKIQAAIVALGGSLK
ncbi:hypothetical protein [Lactiplantibacillus plantarum]|uniref:Prophage Lp2 protein 53 n=1 Tax=Lactiplantibacillus plantarum TaxID=1590 RepID=A0AAW3RE86_LACPN|nr:hypothetical protein [Lactiplantibacillus plantarum]AOB19632.1 hypothetical protein AVR82_08295 [Lactiplantibacillus plantarum]AOB19715.1 hypothetical protein AVR82_08795 [Lactiplantibacillus plantarum]AOB23292.1 hypothetical protein AVR83_10110 [Lactiplantibacillus plantarum]AOB23375.1 hypothetical protein AVR83_10610 [Lactiplantibacillus plantarum]KZU98865.1 prophage Lp2 protein 53 [Lactiplantibacillus plantarum]